jgi:hypothetical protein
MHLAMADLFDHLQETATVDNFLAGKSQSGGRSLRGVRSGASEPSGRFPMLREAPARDAG